MDETLVDQVLRLAIERDALSQAINAIVASCKRELGNGQSVAMDDDGDITLYDVYGAKIYLNPLQARNLQVFLNSLLGHLHPDNESDKTAGA